MANGLRVVSIRIPAIERSAIGSLVTYCDTQTLEDIAKAIMNANLQISYDSRVLITQLDAQFQMKLGKLIEGYECEYSS